MDPIQLILARFRHFPILPFINTIHLSQKVIYIFYSLLLSFCFKKMSEKEEIKQEGPKGPGSLT